MLDETDDAIERTRAEERPVERERQTDTGKSQEHSREPDKSETAPEETSEGEQPDEKKPSFLRRHPFWVLIGILAIAALAVGGYFYWLVNVHPYESTDDAFVDSRQFAIASKVSGYVTDLLVTDNQHVDAGATLFVIDPRDYQVALDQAQAQVEAARASISSADAQIAAQQAQVGEAQAEVEQARASLQFAQEDAKRYQELAQSGTGTVQQAQQAVSNLRQQQANTSRANAAVIAAQKEISSLQAQKANSTATLREAEAQVEQAQLNLSYTTITAAQSGHLVRLTGAKGAYVQAGQSLAMFVPDEIWVTANFKETQITDMRPGQAVQLEIDAYPDAKVTGHVDSIQPGSGTAFSLLPAENATGNYVKVVQRVPVKIVVDKWPEGVSIGPGMSVVPTATVRPRDEH